VLAALGAEFVDELVDGTKSAALPLIRGGLHLSFAQVGLLTAVPLLVGGLIELPMGVLAGTGRRRRRLVLAGGLVFIASLAAAALAGSFAALLAAFVIFFPASGAFVSLTQADLMDAQPSRRDQLMARWTLAGAAGALGGPALLSAAIAAGGTWRTAFGALAAAAAAAWLGVAGGRRVRSGKACGAVTGSSPASPARHGAAPGGEDSPPDSEEEPEPASPREALAAARSWAVLRWVLLAEVANLLLDVLTGFVALYFTAVAGVSPGLAALAVGIRLAADLAGSALLIPVLEHFSGRAVLRASALAALALYPPLLLLPGFWPKVVALALLSLVTSAWYPVIEAELYASLPGRSGVAVSLSSAASLAGALGPLAVGLAAGWLGLGWALAALAAVPAFVLASSGGRRR
jgi:FSR family fosmidomycin resistance protein-like MFS transporter